MSDEGKKPQGAPEAEPKAAPPGDKPEVQAAAEKPAAAAAEKKAPAKPAPKKPAAKKPVVVETPYTLHVAPSPHVANTSLTTRGLMVDVVLGLALVVLAAVWFFRWHAVLVLAVSTVSCLIFEAIFVRMRGRQATLDDFSAVITGIILGLSLPWSTPWWICVVAAMIAIGLGKVIFGSLGQNIFNPAMVGRAFVMVSFSAYLGAGAYVDPHGAAQSILSQATPLTAARTAGTMPELWFLFLGNTNGSLGETSALASILGGLYLVVRRTASWEIPTAMVVVLAALAGAMQLFVGPNPALLAMKMTVLEHLLSGAFLFGAFFIATDPVTSPLSRQGKFYFGAGVSFFVWLLRTFSNYPEGLMFAILLMNSLVPLINRWTVPEPVGGLVPKRG
ncbi:MAG: RnfABCDGE type electron transport complex subunit D [Deltaproteobacteria bacterium]|nr:RnfABCDGE type electron transport complex subunit D [Deltaproteobacteria bacterium]